MQIQHILLNYHTFLFLFYFSFQIIIIILLLLRVYNGSNLNRYTKDKNIYQLWGGLKTSTSFQKSHNDGLKTTWTLEMRYSVKESTWL